MKISDKNSDALKIKIRQLEKSKNDLIKRIERITSLINNLPGMAFRCIYDKNLTFEFASKGTVEILGYEPEEIVSGLAFRQMVHPEDQHCNKKTIAELTPEKNRYDMIYRMRAAWGEYRWIHEQGTAVFSAEGSIVAIEGLLTDITHQKINEIKLQKENLRLRSSMKDRYRFGQLIGKSEAMQSVYDRILKAADVMASVIITGESGTGKELAAKAIHELGDRRDGPFVTVNCGAIPENLMESEFFGHLRGAFSGAYATRSGFLVAADGGTLFLDEIGEMPVHFQVKLLRALEQKKFTPVGGPTVFTSDFRIISATNRDLGQMVRSGAMREDFYYRINTIPIVMPPLREREEDLPLLIDHFVAQHANEIGHAVTLPPEIYLTLSRHHWPGNIRELKNVISRYLTLKEICINPFQQTEAVGLTARADEPGASEPIPTSVNRELAEVEKDLILNALSENCWHMGRTAAALGISRRTLQRRVNKYGLKLAENRPKPPIAKN